MATMRGPCPWGEYRARKATIDQMLGTARSQADRAEYESAYKTYQSLLKTDPGNRAAALRQLPKPPYNADVWLALVLGDC